MSEHLRINIHEAFNTERRFFAIWVANDGISRTHFVFGAVMASSIGLIYAEWSLLWSITQ